MTHWLSKLILGFSGLVLLVIGVALLLDPLGFAASNGALLPNDASVLSEVRAPGGLLTVVGLLMLACLFSARHLPTGLWAGGVVYCSYGSARLLGLLIDGMPSSTLVQAMTVEWIIGLACFAAAARRSMAQRAVFQEEAIREGLS